jgi:hypothetical protein
MLVIPISSGALPALTGASASVGQPVAALGLAGASRDAAAVRPAGRAAASNRSATSPFEQFQFDFANGLLTLAGDDLAAVERDLDARSLPVASAARSCA